jgi:hypothetical protein
LSCGIGVLDGIDGLDPLVGVGFDGVEAVGVVELGVADGVIVSTCDEAPAPATAVS